MGRLDWRTLGAELTTADLLTQLAYDALEAETQAERALALEAANL